MPILLQADKFPASMMQGEDDDQRLELFLDGTMCANTQRSDCCIAWMTRMHKVGDNARRVPEEEEGAHVSAVKKAALALQKEKALAKLIVPTHKVVFVKCEVDAMGPDGNVVTYHLERPVLTDSDKGKDIMGAKCCREAMPWDEVEFKKSSARTACAKGFTMT